MATNSSSQYIGKIASLISTANIRYEGTIYMINNDTITLKNGITIWQSHYFSENIRNRGSQV